MLFQEEEISAVEHEKKKLRLYTKRERSNCRRRDRKGKCGTGGDKRGFLR
jgi:hypothetical protein